jgi:dienelactone hydrolase
MNEIIAALFGGLQRIEPPQGVSLLPIGGTKRPLEPIWERRYGDRWIRNLFEPCLIPVLPEPELASGTAVMVLPGGAFRALAVDNEGIAVATWLAKKGIAAYVMLYRLLPTPEDTRELYVQLSHLVEQAGPRFAEVDLGPPMTAIDDCIAGLKLVRNRASEAGAQHIGVLGFSAGGILSLALGASDEHERPDFVGALYPNLDVIPVMPEPPPLFIATCCDDPLFGGRGFGIVEAWNEAGGDVVLNAFAQGGHGFGLTHQNLPSDAWPTLFLEWLRERGYFPTS